MKNKMVTLSSLESVLDIDDNPCHLKCATTGKYLYSNSANLAAYKFTEAEFIGLVMYDLYDHLEWDDWFYNDALKSEERVISEKKMIIIETPGFKNANGLMLCEKRIKKPIYGNDNKILAILTKSIIKPTANISSYMIKQKKYVSKKNIVKYLLSYFCVEDYFYNSKDLLYSELLIIMTLIENKEDISISSKVLGVSHRTIKQYIYSVRDKLKISLKLFFREIRKKTIIIT